MHSDYLLNTHNTTWI